MLELQKILKEKLNVSILDVRRKSDYEASPQKIKNATWYDPEKIDEWINEIPKDPEVIVYCVKGGSAANPLPTNCKKSSAMLNLSKEPSKHGMNQKYGSYKLAIPCHCVN